MKNNVSTYRNAGLEAKWGRRGDTPFMFVRNPNGKLKHQREKWWHVDKAMCDRMQVVGILQAFEEHTLLGDIFSVPA